MRASFAGTMGGGQQGVTATPRPATNTAEAKNVAVVRRAQYIAGGLFLVMVCLHSK